MNSHHPNIQFTFEEEYNGELSSLDMSTAAMNSKLVTSL